MSRRDLWKLRRELDKAGDSPSLEKIVAIHNLRKQIIAKARDKRVKGLSSFQRLLKKKEDETRKRLMRDPALHEVERKPGGMTIPKLICPKCGESDRGNRMNGKPWCFRCNVALKREGEK